MFIYLFGNNYIFRMSLKIIQPLLRDNNHQPLLTSAHQDKTVNHSASDIHLVNKQMVKILKEIEKCSQPTSIQDSKFVMLYQASTSP